MREQAFPTPEEASSDESLKEYIKQNLGCVFHPVGTASMLPREDGGVVDHELKVYGTANVRVVSRRSSLSRLSICRLTTSRQVDASILPLVGPVNKG